MNKQVCTRVIGSVIRTTRGVAEEATMSPKDDVSAAQSSDASASADDSPAEDDNWVTHLRQLLNFSGGNLDLVLIAGIVSQEFNNDDVAEFDTRVAQPRSNSNSVELGDTTGR